MRGAADRGLRAASPSLRTAYFCCTPRLGKAADFRPWGGWVGGGPRGLLSTPAAPGAASQPSFLPSLPHSEAPWAHRTWEHLCAGGGRKLLAAHGSSVHGGVKLGPSATWRRDPGSNKARHTPSHLGWDGQTKSSQPSPSPVACSNFFFFLNILILLWGGRGRGSVLLIR